MIKQEERLSRLEQKVDDLKEDVSEIKQLIKDLDHKFAPKYIERLLWFIMTAVVTAITYILTGSLHK